MSPRSSSEEPVVSVGYNANEQPDGGPSQRARKAFLMLARLIGKQMAREHHAMRRASRDDDAQGGESDRG
jgi:hypothetical protein